MTRPILTSLALVLTLAACGKKANDALAQGTKAPDAPPKSGASISACALIPVTAMNALIGSKYTASEGLDSGEKTSTGCHYTSETDPAGMSVNIQWIDASEYSDPAEHAALQKAGIAGARLGGKLTKSMVAGGVPGIPSGPEDGIGDEATWAMMLLTARKGDYTVMVQIVPTDMMAMMTDSTVAIAYAEKTRLVARTVLAKL